MQESQLMPKPFTVGHGTGCENAVSQPEIQPFMANQKSIVLAQFNDNPYYLQTDK